MLSYQYRMDETTAPTEAQMKLAIAQTLSLPFAYNAPVVVLNFEVDEDGGITGNFKDAARPRVFSFELDGESVSYSPFKPGKMDSLDSEDGVIEWEEFSAGYSYRVDAGIGTGKKPQCVKPTAYNCGSACINVNKNCKSNAYDSVSKDRMKKLAEIAKSYTKARRKAKPLSDEEFELEKKSIAADKKLAEVKSQRKQGVPRKEGEGVLEKSKDPVTKDIIKRGKIKTPEQAKEIIDHLKKTFSSKGKHTEGAATALIEGFKIKNKVQADIMISKLEKHLADQETPEAKPKAESKKPSGQKSTAKKTTEPKVKPDPKVEPKLEVKPSVNIKLVGDGTHEGAPKDAQEYYDMMTKQGNKITMKEAEDLTSSAWYWSAKGSGEIRRSQQKGKPNKEAKDFEKYVSSLTPYKGDIYRGMAFKSKEEATKWLKGDENGLLDNQSAHASWSSKESVAKLFADPMMHFGKDKNISVIIKSVNKTGVSIQNLSRFGDGEAEVVVPKNARHRVKSVKEENGLFYVEVEEV